MAVLVTGGAGYIGSHVCLELMRTGVEVVAVDNYNNSSPLAVQRVKALSGKEMPIYDANLLDKDRLAAVFTNHPIEAVIHLAGLKSVRESVEQPLAYYENNVTGSLVLFEFMKRFGVCKMVFSSSATVYGAAASMPIREDAPVQPVNPYGRTKAMIEQILLDLCSAESSWSVAMLRYFNPAGADASGIIGENPRGVANNLFPYIAQVAAGKLERVNVYGSGYPTPDGTGIRDYIHITDLALGHVKALEHVLRSTGAEAYNLGTGHGYSVMEVIRAFERASGRTIPYTLADKRPGDVARCLADPAKAERELQWRAQRGIDEMCADAWRWQTNNPNGYV